jgi:hypothetical protein
MVLRHIFRILIGLALLGLVFLKISPTAPVLAQEAPTPIVVQLASPTPLPVLGVGAEATPSPTPTPTETPIGPVQLEVASGQENVNVRSAADPESSILGVIAPGERYAVTGRYFRWIQFRFPNSPNGLGFVYDELVQLIGDTSLIPDLTVVGTINTDPLSVAPPGDGSGVTPQAVDPAAEATASAEARLLEGPVAVDPNATPGETNLNPEGDVRLPTYTPAPNIGDILSALNQPPTATPEPDPLEEISRTASNLPPIAPILLVGGLGVLGFAISLIRRG